MRENSNTSEPAIFGVMLSEVAEDAGLLDESAELRQMVQYLQAVISHRPDKSAEAMKRGVDEFRRAYGDSNHSA